MFLDNKLIFLAGATGVAGSSIMRYILDHHPTTRLRAAYYTDTPPFIEHERVEYRCGDLRQPGAAADMVRGCDGAILAAAVNAAGAAVAATAPWRQVTGNVVLNSQLLEACCSEHIRRVVCIGSITLYQEFEGHIKEEDLDLNQDPHPAYRGIGWTVRFIEKLCQFWHEQAGLEMLIVRSANIFGPYVRFDPAGATFVPAIIRKAVARQDPFEVWGSPEVTRDVIYAEDFGRAISLLMDNDALTYDTFNIGSGQQTTVGQVVTWALQAAGHSPQQINYLQDRPTTNKFRALDCSKAERLLGWKPRYTVAEGIQKTTAWWEANKDWWAK